MGLIKSIKKYAKIAKGAITIGAFGDTKWGEAHWNLEKKGYENNIHFEDTYLDRAIFGGDSGDPGPIRDEVVREIEHYRPRQLWLLGDLGYPIGVTDENDFQKHLVEPFGNLGTEHISTDLVDGNHDAYGSKWERGFLNRKLFAGPLGRFRKPNFYGARVYHSRPDLGVPAALVVWFDSTVYDVKLGDPEIQDRQESFVRKILLDDRFRGHLKIVVAHHGAVSKLSHGNTHSSDYMKHWAEDIAPRANICCFGHDHGTHQWGTYRGCLVFTFGAMSKCKSSKEVQAYPGFGILEKGVMRPLKIKPLVAFKETDE